MAHPRSPAAVRAQRGDRRGLVLDARRPRGAVGRRGRFRGRPLLLRPTAWAMCFVRSAQMQRPPVSVPLWRPRTIPPGRPAQTAGAGARALTRARAGQEGEEDDEGDAVTPPLPTVAPTHVPTVHSLSCPHEDDTVTLACPPLARPFRRRAPAHGGTETLLSEPQPPPEFHYYYIVSVGSAASRGGGPSLLYLMSSVSVMRELSEDQHS